MPQTVGSFDLTICLNIKPDGGISYTSDGTDGSTPNGMHVRTGQYKLIGVSCQHHLTQCQTTHFQVMPEIFIYILLSPKHCSKLQLRYLSSQRTYSPNYRDLNHLARSIKLQQTGRSLRNLS